METPLSRAEFTRQVADAYEHLYDPIFFRTYPLTRLLVRQAEQTPKEQGWELQRLLLAAIDELDPGPFAPAFSLEVRRYQLMALRYVDGLDPQTVAGRLGISRRHFYREHEAAITALVGILWQRVQALPPVDSSEQPDPVLTLSELLRVEAARLAQADRYSQLAEVLPGILALLAERLNRQRLQIVTDLASDLPAVGLVRNLLREVLLVPLGFLVERCTDATLTLSARADGARTHIALLVEPVASADRVSLADISDCLATVASLLVSPDHGVQPVVHGDAIAGFELILPARDDSTIIFVDDNTDFLELVQRFLPQHGYRVIALTSAHDLLALASEIQPACVVLDLMMPGEDGWEILQKLSNQPDTQHIPVVVCSVLQAHELAISLGATAFLPKPISEQALLTTLRAVEQPR